MLLRGPVKILLGIISCVLVYFGLDRLGLWPSWDSTPNRNQVAVDTPVNWQIPRSQTSISIGTFNIQVFGSTKLADPNVMDVLVKIARQFDCLAIQELRSKDQTIIPRFVEMINANGSQYRYEVGHRLGNSMSKEQYVYLYDSTRIEKVQPGFTVPDHGNRLHREPWVCTFRTRTADPSQSFTFSLVNIHTDPDETTKELAALYDVYWWLRQLLNQEDDLILLGDFNEAPRNLGPLRQIPGMTAVIPDGIPTNTAKTKGFDNILFHHQATAEYTGQAGVMDLMQTFALTSEQAKKVSDHMPVWALFTSYEMRPTQYATGYSATPGPRATSVVDD